MEEEGLEDTLRFAAMPSCLSVLLLAASATALNVGAPVLRSSLPAMRRPFPVMEEEEEAMTEEEYEAMLAAESSAPVATAPPPPAKEEEDLLSPEEVARIKRKIESYAPWMNVDPEAIARAKKAREDRKAQAPTQVDAMNLDPQAAELNAATGLNSKVLSEDEIELRWETTNEESNVGFIVQRRAGGESDFESIATYENFAPLKSKGVQGGVYVYLDAESGLQPGTWVYRIVDCDTSGAKSAMCQKLVEIESKDEQMATLVVGGLIAGLALVFVAAGIFIDPIQTTQSGRGF